MTTPASGDYLVISDSGTDKKIDATLVPWTNANAVFTKDSPTLTLTPSSGRAQIIAASGDNGAGTGSYVSVARNSNASTPAAGFIYMQPHTATTRRVWVDNSGSLRIHTADPTNANDTAGTVVGAQTSSLDAKDITGGPLSAAAVLLHIAQAAAAVRQFVYKDGSFNGEEFSGLIVDFAPRYGMDRDAEHPAGKSLNVITALGDLMIAVDHLAQRVMKLEARLNTARAD
jgi:hypothetical protein